MQIQYTNKISVKDGVKTVVYGRSGSGKTRLSATAPRPIILSAEKGLLSLRKINIPYIDISTYKELVDGYNWIMKSGDSKKYDTICLDSCSEIAEVVLAEESKKNKDPRKAYGETQQQMYSMIRSFRDLEQRNVYFIAKEMLIATEGFDGGKRAVPIMPSDKLQQQLPYFFDLVLHLFVGKDTQGKEYEALHCKTGTGWEAKDRSGNLDEIEYADLSYIFKKATA